MASSQTTNYGLNQWAAEDQVIREEFNADNAKIDAALGTIPKFACGAYTGDGTQGRIIEVGFTPKVVLVICADSARSSNRANSSSYYYDGLAVEGSPVTTDENTAVVTVVEGGFQVECLDILNYSYDRYLRANYKGYVYHYFALG